MRLISLTHTSGQSLKCMHPLQNWTREVLYEHQMFNLVLLCFVRNGCNIRTAQMSLRGRARGATDTELHSQWLSILAGTRSGERSSTCWRAQIQIRSGTRGSVVAASDERPGMSLFSWPCLVSFQFLVVWFVLLCLAPSLSRICLIALKLCLQ